jgi:hypothetical protein
MRGLDLVRKSATLKETSPQVVLPELAFPSGFESSGLYLLQLPVRFRQGLPTGFRHRPFFEGVLDKAKK